jgi:hypothetical protein
VGSQVTLDEIETLAKGSLIAGRGVGTALAALPVGADGQVLTADSTKASGLAYAAAASGGRTIATARGAIQLDAATVQANLTGFGTIERIRRARFWLSELETGLGAAAEEDAILRFFNNDTFKHLELGTIGAQGLVAELPQFAFNCSLLVGNHALGSAAFDLVSVDDFLAGDLLAVWTATALDFNRVSAVDSGANQLDTEEVTERAYSANDNLSRVLEIGGFDYEDKDSTGEVHLEVASGANNFWLQYWVEYEKQ